MSEYETRELTEVQCPECDSDNVVKTERTHNGVQPLPPDKAGQCRECEHVAHPLAFHAAYERAQMTDEELNEHERLREQAKDKQAAWQESAHYHSLQREP